MCYPRQLRRVGTATTLNSMCVLSDDSSRHPKISAGMWRSTPARRRLNYVRTLNWLGCVSSEIRVHSLTGKTNFNPKCTCTKSTKRNRARVFISRAFVPMEIDVSTLMTNWETHAILRITSICGMFIVKLVYLFP